MSGRLGAVSLRPPIESRAKRTNWKPVGGTRSITSVDNGNHQVDGECSWCERYRTVYRYCPANFGRPEFGTLNTDSGLKEMRFCSWMCVHQWLDWMDLVEEEVEMWLALGVTPEWIPDWHPVVQMARCFVEHAS